MWSSCVSIVVSALQPVSTWEPPFREEDSFGNTSSLGEDSGGEEAVSWESGEDPRTTTCGEQAGDSKAAAQRDSEWFLSLATPKSFSQLLVLGVWRGP